MKHWTAAEDALLRELYPAEQELATRFPRRTAVAIGSRARKLGIAKVSRKDGWTAAEVDLLTKLWPVSHPAEVMRHLPGRTYRAVRVKASKLKLGKAIRVGGKRRHDADGACRCNRKTTCWSLADLDFIERRYGLQSVASIARRVGRSEAAVRVKANRMGLREVDSGLTTAQVAEIFGCSVALVRRWMDEGLLPARKLRHNAPHGFIFLFDEPDVERFVIEQPWQFDARKMPDSYYRDRANQWVTLTEAFERGAPHSSTLGLWSRLGLIPEAKWRGRERVIPEALIGQLAGRARRPGQLFRDEYSMTLAARRVRRAQRRRAA